MDATATIKRTEGVDPLMCDAPRIVNLGTLPGGESLEHREYYYSNSNRIWQVLCLLTGEPMPRNYEQKKTLLAKYHIVLWDYYKSAIRPGSEDRKIKDGIPNDMVAFVRENPTIDTFAINGFGKYKKFGKRILNSISAGLPGKQIRVLRLPETSGANKNHGWGDVQNLANEWNRIFD